MLPLANVAAHGRDLDTDQYWRGDLHARSFVLSFVFDFRALPSLLIPFVGIPFFVFFGKCGGWHRPTPDSEILTLEQKCIKHLLVDSLGV